MKDMRQVIQAGTRSSLYYPITRSSSIDRFVGLSLPTVQPAPHPFSSTFPLIENQPANFILSESLALCFQTMQLFSSFFPSMVTPVEAAAAAVVVVFELMFVYHRLDFTYQHGPHWSVVRIRFIHPLKYAREYGAYVVFFVVGCSVRHSMPHV